MFNPKTIFMNWHNHHTTVITGACGGIGKAFASQCAALGHRLVLIDLDLQQLRQLQQWLVKNHQVEVFVVKADISNLHEIETLANFFEIHRLRITWLINNAGIGHTSLFERTASSHLYKELSVNVLGTTLLTHALLPFFNHYQQGCILFMSSLASFYALPFKNTYGASKAYVTQFAGALRFELKDRDISVSVCCPGFVNSTVQQFLSIARLPRLEQMLTINPKIVVAQAIEGVQAGKHLIIPGLMARLLFHITRMLPAGMLKKATERKFRSMKGLLLKPVVNPAIG